MKGPLVLRERDAMFLHEPLMHEENTGAEICLVLPAGYGVKYKGRWVMLNHEWFLSEAIKMIEEAENA